MNNLERIEQNIPGQDLEGELFVKQKIEEYKKILDDISREISSMNDDLKLIQENPQAIPQVDNGIKFLNYIKSVAEGSFIRDFMPDFEKVIEIISKKYGPNDIVKLVPLSYNLRNAQRVVWDLDEDFELFINSMNKIKSSKELNSMDIETYDIYRVSLFYILVNGLNHYVKEISEIFDKKLDKYK